MQRNIVLTAILSLLCALTFQAIAQEKNSIISAIVYGKASGQSIASRKAGLMKATCRMAASNALQVEVAPLLKAEGYVFAKKTRSGVSAELSFSGSVSGVSLHSCKHFENGDCLCKGQAELNRIPQHWYKPIPALPETGYLDEDTAVVNVSASTNRGISSLQRQYLCETAARTQAIADFYYKMKTDAPDSIRLPLPATRATCMGSSKSTEWNTCECRVMLYKEKLKNLLAE